MNYLIKSFNSVDCSTFHNISKIKCTMTIHSSLYSFLDYDSLVTIPIPSNSATVDFLDQ